MEQLPSENMENYTVNVELLKSIQNFMDDLANVTESKNFIDYRTIVNRIDESKVKSYNKLINGFKEFFDHNAEPLTQGNFEDLCNPNISYVTDSGSFSFDFQKTFHDTDQDNQDIIKDHLNHIWSLINNQDKSPEELYINKIFNDLKTRFSTDMTREEQITIAKDLFSDFQRQNLDISLVIKAACQKSRKLLLSAGSTDSKTLVLIDAVEEIDVNNFNMVQFMTLVSKVGTMFANDENNPLNEFLAGLFSGSDNSLSIENLNLGDME